MFSIQDEIGLKEWALSLRSAHKLSQELLGSMARKAGKIYGTERDATTKVTMIATSGSSGGSTTIGGTGTATAVGITTTTVTTKNTNGSN